MNCIEVNHAAASVMGIKNRNKATLCEDVFCIDEASTTKFYGLADGQTGKEYCRTGGEKALTAVFDFIAEKGIPVLREYEHIDELQYELIRIIRDTISRLAEEQSKEKTEYASTLVAFAYDTESKEFIVVHLGDGGILGKKTNGELCMISSPDNGLTSSYTWLTTSQDALCHLRIGFGSIESFQRIVLITDGATVIARGKNIPEASKSTIAAGSKDNILSLLKNSNPMDDASCIVIDLPK